MEAKFFKITNKKNSEAIALRAIFAKSFYSRLKGLMFTHEMDNYDALILTPCNSIHTCFMKFNIDVLFLDKNYKVLEIKKKMPPWRATAIYWKSVFVIELKSGEKKINVSKGDELEVVCLN